MSQDIFSLRERTALVTGASDGLGWSCARALAQAGARVIVAARRVDRLDALVKEIEAAGGSALAVSMDVSAPESVQQAFNELDAQHWRADILVNNAGLGLQLPWLETDETAWERLLQTNLLGADRVARAVCQRLVEAGQAGTVIHVASVLGLTSQPITAAYGASKAALIQLTKKMAVELARHRITVNCIAPGMFRTAMVDDFSRSARGETYLKMTLSRRVGEPEELTGTLLYLASRAAAYVNGVVIPVDGGNHLRGL
jgi:NAD(P)-dependent dehydrogenase (short-subunit alcohol dehydrogenase family)